MWGRERAAALGKAQKLELGLEHVLRVRTAHCDEPAVDCGIAVRRAVMYPSEGQAKVTPSSLAKPWLETSPGNGL